MEHKVFTKPVHVTTWMGVFLALVAVLAAVLVPQLKHAFLANAAFNGLIVFVLAIGIAVNLRQVWRLQREVLWIEAFQQHPDATADTPRPTLLAPMARLLSSRKRGQFHLSPASMRTLLDSVQIRLEEQRDLSRYLIGLLIFLGLLGTFWGLIETVGSVGKVIEGLKVGGDAGSMFDALKEGLAAPLGGMGISFSSSLFGLAGSLVLGFLDLQASQAQNRFYTEVEDWLSTTVRELGGGVPAAGAPVQAAAIGNEMRAALDRLQDAISEAGANKAATHAMANLAEGIQALVQHMRQEQQIIRDWVEAQAEQQAEVQRLLQVLARQHAEKT